MTGKKNVYNDGTVFKGVNQTSQTDHLYSDIKQRWKLMHENRQTRGILSYVNDYMEKQEPKNQVLDNFLNASPEDQMKFGNPYNMEIQKQYEEMQQQKEEIIPQEQPKPTGENQ